MKKELLKLLTLVSALVCLLSLNACGNTDVQSSPEEPESVPKAENQIITFYGVNFSIPAYYDFLDVDSTEDYLHYFPKQEDYYSSLVFQAEDTNIAPSDFKEIRAGLGNAVSETVGENITLLDTGDITVADLSGWKASFNEDGDVTNLCIIHNIYENKIITIIQAHDSNDQSDFDYDGDFFKMLESATLIRPSSNSKESLAKPPADSTESPSTSTGEMIGSGDLGDFYVEIKGGQLTKDYEGNLVCVITYSWTNNSDETTSAIYKIRAQAFQDGVELDNAYMIFDTSVYESGTSMKDVRPGATTDIQCAFVLTNETSDIEVELSECFNFSKNPPKVVKTFTMN